jgi:hypothetical protein
VIYQVNCQLMSSLSYFSDRLLQSENTHRSASFQSGGYSHPSRVKETKEINVKWNVNLVDSPSMFP